MYVAEDPHVSERLRRFLAGRSRRVAWMDEQIVRSAAVLNVDGQAMPAPEELVIAMVRFEQRYGGLSYTVIGGDDMEYGLHGDPTGYHSPHGPAFTGICDGDWTWDVDVLVDGRTAMQPGSWSHRIIDRSVDQRLEKHAMLISVRHWPHRTYTCVFPAGQIPVISGALLPTSVPEATGPADMWFASDRAAVQFTLRGWPPEHDQWIVRYFAHASDLAVDPAVTVRTALGRTVKPADWCALCATPLAADAACPASPAAD
ncbi:hypothetical protein J5X84_41900 [Streptosporangiaceae bacterium NEAU-GS5]|nr:hypothetical protein [Streptosporangiaceae bacterium NEAU-GS5]